MVAAYGLILPQAVLDAPRHGCLNVHGSLLPRWRGAAPVQRAIMAGDAVTGVTIMAMEAGLDTGPMIAKREIAIDRKNAAQVTQELAKLGAAMMVEVIAAGVFEGTPQPGEGVTYAAKISKEEARIDWTRPAREIARQVQGLAPFPGAWFEVAGERIKLLDGEAAEAEGAPGEVIDEALTIACGEGAIRPTLLQRAGRSPMAAGRLAARLRDSSGHAARMTRWRLTVEYDGGPFVGWQRQAIGELVQGVLERAIATMTGEAVTVHGAGRTDAGVHALAMEAHVDIAKPLTEHRLREGINALVRPALVSVLDVEQVADDWHARFSCSGDATSIASSTTAPRPLCCAARCGTSPRRSTSRRWRGRWQVAGNARFHDLSVGPLPVGEPGQVARRIAHRAGRRRDPRPRRGAQLPPSPSALNGRLPGDGRARAMVARGYSAALAARDRTALGLNAPPEGLYFVSASYPG